MGRRKSPKTQAKKPQRSEPRPVGRPTDYSPDIAEKICVALASGEKSLRKICEGEGFPDKSTVMVWLYRYPEFQDQYARAKAAQMDSYAEESVEIADTVLIGQRTKVTEKGTEVTTYDMVERSKLMVETRKSLMTRLAPKKYGDRIETEHTGTVGVHSMSEADLVALAGPLIAKLKGGK